MAKLVSKTYGEALFKLAMDQGRLDELEEEARVVLEVFEENPDLSKFLNHPQISQEEKIRVIENIFKKSFSDDIVGFLALIVEKGRHNEVGEIFRYFLAEAMEHKKIGVAHVASAFPLSDGQKGEIEKRLLETTRYVKFVMEYEVDPSLLGGVVIRIGDRVVDGSVRTKIAEMSRSLSQIQLSQG